ncbi:MAG: ribosome maturation factor RimP [Candidatus Latescibacteria bacterium]|nr:ribosome maturation factor RimP [Candidatus Latescibacterota bacterium]
MDDAELLVRIEQVIRPLLESEAFELVELNLGGSRRRRRLCVFADRPGGITLDECARLNRMIGGALEAEDPIEGSYVLEVSSPGLDRLLKTERDFARSTGRKVRVILSSGAVHVGILKACFEEAILLDVSGTSLKLERGAIAKANLEVEF